MANDDKEHVRGLVRTLRYGKPASLRQLTDNPLIEFYRNASRVIRVPGLSDPVLKPNLKTEDLLCQKAFTSVKRIVKEIPELNRVPFVILDGTSWFDSEDTVDYGLDILFINVFWDDQTPVVCVYIGWRMAIKSSKIYRVNKDPMYPIVFKYDLTKTDKEMEEVINVAIDTKITGDVASMTARITLEALLETCQPEIEYPVAAATYLDGVVWYVDRPHRHFHISQSVEFHDALASPDITESPLQGFLTNHGNFVDRYRAMFMAINKGMIINTPNVFVDIKTTNEIRKFSGLYQVADNTANGYIVANTALFSEDLW